MSAPGDRGRHRRGNRVASLPPHSARSADAPARRGMTQDARAKAEEALKLAQTKAALLQANSAPKRPGE